MAEKGQDQQTQTQQGSQPLEMAAMWLSAALILAAAGYLVYEGLQTAQPASFHVQVEPVRSEQGRYYLPLLVKNTGDQNVHGLNLQVQLVDRQQGPANVLERSRVSLQWVPAHSQRRAVTIFNRDPNAYEIRTRIEGYAYP